jgi:CheY-like chemotaxis protein
MVPALRVDVRNLKVCSFHSQISLPLLRGQLFSCIGRKIASVNTNLANLEVARIGMARRKATILCIDDHWSGLIGRKCLLENDGYKVMQATSGDDGLKLFASHAVDAVVLDYQMPGMNGDVVAAKMKRIKSHVPIMMLSAYGPLPQAKLEAVDTFLSKSQPPMLLLSTLQHLLDIRPKLFFNHWLDTWRSRNEGVK